MRGQQTVTMIPINPLSSPDVHFIGIIDEGQQSRTPNSIHRKQKQSGIID